MSWQINRINGKQLSLLFLPSKRREKIKTADSVQLRIVVLLFLQLFHIITTFLEGDKGDVLYSV